MNIILFTTVHGRPGSLNLSRPRIYIPLMAVMLSLLSGLVYLGYSWGQSAAGVEPRELVADWRADVESQRRSIEQARRETEAHLDALAGRLGQMQAQMLRMEGLGERLVDVAGLDKGEFDFSQLPAQGGPVSASTPSGFSVPDLMSELDAMSRVLDDREQQLSVLETVLLNRELQKQGVPAGRPVTSGWMSSKFGKRTDPFTGKPAIHEGVDFAGKLNSDVVAVAAGVVTWSGKRYGYGNLVEVNHGNGYVTRYGHCRENLVKVGETVKPGQVIARMGSSGRSTGPHVHFEVLKHGRPINPEKFVWASR